MRLNFLLSLLFTLTYITSNVNSEPITLATLSSLAGISGFIITVVKNIYDFSKSQSEKLDPALRKPQVIYPNIVADNPEIVKAIQEIPEISSLIQQREGLKKDFMLIDIAFDKAVGKYEKIMKGQAEIPIRYENFRNDYEQILDLAINSIRNVLINDDAASHLEKDFKTSLQKFENVCLTGMSGVQLLHELYQKYAIASGKYFATKNLMYDFLQVFQKQNLSATREILYDNEKKALTDSIHVLKTVMAKASLDVYKCNSSEGTYVELPVFQKYYKKNVATRKNHYPQCEKITKTNNNECEDDDTIDDEPCLNSRHCSGKLYCSTIFTDENSKDKHSSNSTIVCVNDDIQAKSRYLYVDEYVNGTIPVYCPENSKKVNLTWADDYGIRYASYVDPCDCVCEEEFFIDSSEVFANVADNKVVTGTKLTLKENTLFIQILEGELLTSGIVNTSTYQWVPKYEDLKSKVETRIPITWDGVKEFSLAANSLPEDRIITGMKFDTKFKNLTKINSRIGLTVFSKRFNFTTGKLFNNEEALVHLPESGWQEFNLTNCDVPSRSKRDNKLDSTDDQFLTLKLSDLKKDGGQTTIPFIDIQNVVTNPPVPLKGIGLYHKGEPSFGGFMGLKLLSYNITSQIKEDFDLDKSVLIDGLKTLSDAAGKQRILFIEDFVQAVKPLGIN